MYTEISEPIIENVRKENDIVSVVEEYVQLKKQGKNYFGLCPFHDEKSPSFSVTQEKQIFHCFGCGKGGNVITFLMEIETFTFVEAVTHLANRAGITLPETRRKATSLSEESSLLLSAYDWLTKYYYHLLKYSDEGKIGLEYFLNRGIKEETIDEFQLGYSPTNSDFTIEFMKKKGFHQQLLVKAGLLSTKDNLHFVDVFRGRVLFPIKNHLGRTVAFGGRAFEGEEPKYLNSQEHELFQKGNLLFNFNLAKNHIRKQSEVIIFEGYMDVLAAHQAGIKNVIATLGTALTNNQAKLLTRYVDTVILCYDADDAGMNASFQAANLLHEMSCNVKIANIPKNMDPDDYIKSFGGDSFKKQVIEVSDTFFKFFMKYKKRAYNLTVDSERIAYIEEVVKQLANIESTIESEYYVKELADEFNLSTDIIHHDLNKYKRRNNRQFKDKSIKNSNTINRIGQYNGNKILPAYQNAEKFLISHMLKHPYIIDRVQQQLGVSFNVEAHKIILTHLYALYEEKNEIDVSELIDKLDDNHLKTVLTEIAIAHTNETITDDEINDYIEIIRREATDLTRLRTLKEKLKTEKNPILAAQIGLEIIDMEKQLKQMK